MSTMFRSKLGLMGVTCAAVFSACVDLAGPIPGTGGSVTSAPLNPAPTTGGTSTDTPPPPAPGQAGSSAGDSVSFDDDVHPILAAMCGECHTGLDSLPGHGAADADDAFEAVQGMSMGEPVYMRILDRTSGVGGFMPPEYAGCGGALGAPGCLSEAEFNLIQLWVDQGASAR
jgi:hypothetical protein